MSISTYFRPNIHPNGPEILGVKNIWGVNISNLEGDKKRSFLLVFMEE
jgi:hypothetical protein